MRGAYNLLVEHRVHYIFSEFGPNMMKQKGGDPLAYLKFFSSLGYTVRTHNDSIVPPSLFEEYIRRIGKDITDIVLHKDFPDSPFRKMQPTVFAEVPSFSSHATSQSGTSVTSLTMELRLDGDRTADSAARTSGIGSLAHSASEDVASGLPLSMTVRWRGSRPSPKTGGMSWSINVNIVVLGAILVYALLTVIAVQPHAIQCLAER